MLEKMRFFLFLFIFTRTTTLPFLLHHTTKCYLPSSLNYLVTRKELIQRQYISNDDQVDLLLPVGIDTKDNWTKMFNQLLRFNIKKTENYGGLVNKIDMDSEGVRLRYWVNAQLHQINLFTSGERKKLPPSMTLERSEKLLEVLQDLGYTFDLPKRNSTEIINPKFHKRTSPWEKRFTELEQFKEQNGHCDVPQTYPTNPKLGHWVNRQRSEYRAILKYGKKNSFLTPNRIEALESIEFLWSSKLNQQRWLDQYEKLVQYYQEHGTSLVPKSHPELGIWVQSVRVQYKKGKLLTENIKLLENINFSWGYTTIPWEHRYEELRLYKKKYGDCLVPRSEASLGRWVNRQRKEYKYLLEGRTKTAMTTERAARLNEIEFAWKHPRGKYLKRQTQIKQNDTSVDNEL